MIYRVLIDLMAWEEQQKQLFSSSRGSLPTFNFATKAVSAAKSSSLATKLLMPGLFGTDVEMLKFHPVFSAIKRMFEPARIRGRFIAFLGVKNSSCVARWATEKLQLRRSLSQS